MKVQNTEGVDAWLCLGAEKEIEGPSECWRDKYKMGRCSVRNGQESEREEKCGGRRKKGNTDRKRLVKGGKTV